MTLDYPPTPFPFSPEDVACFVRLGMDRLGSAVPYVTRIRGGREPDPAYAGPRFSKGEIHRPQNAW